MSLFMLVKWPEDRPGLFYSIVSKCSLCLCLGSNKYTVPKPKKHFFDRLEFYHVTVYKIGSFEQCNDSLSKVFLIFLKISC